MHRNISMTITGICRYLNIPYTSPHLLECDIIRLGQIMNELDSLSNEIECICERHNINGNKKYLKKDQEAIRDIIHDLSNIAQKLISQK